MRCQGAGIYAARDAAGFSVTTVQETRQAQADGADYIGVGAMFPTGTKADAILAQPDIKRAAAELKTIFCGGGADEFPRGSI